MTPKRPILLEERELRIGRKQLAKRLKVQVDHSAKFFGQGFNRLHGEKSNLLSLALGFLLKISGLYRVGRKNALDFEVVEVGGMLKDLPEAFAGFRLLRLSGH